MADSLASPGRRVKVYVLNEMGGWDDRGTGHVHLEKENDVYLIKVFSEDTARVTLCSQVHPLGTKSAYYMQEETIISWLDAALDNTEVALSFAEPDECRDTWTKLRELENALSQSSSAYPDASSSLPVNFVDQNSASASLTPHSLSLPLAVGPSNEPSDALVSPAECAFSSALDSGALHRSHHSPVSGNHVTLVDAASAADITHPSRFFGDALDNTPPWNSDPIDDGMFRDTSSVFFLSTSPVSFMPQGTSSDIAITPSNFTMPEPSRAGLEALSKIFSDQNIIQFAAVRERIISEVSSGDYVSRLCQVFRNCEEKADFEGLAILYHVVRYFFILASGNVPEVLVREDHLMDIVGCLEYDPDRVANVERRHEEAKNRSRSVKSKKKSVPESQPMEVDSAASQALGTSLERNETEDPGCDLDGTSSAHSGDGAGPSKPSAADDTFLRNQSQRSSACQGEASKVTSKVAHIEVDSKATNLSGGVKHSIENTESKVSRLGPPGPQGDEDNISSASCENRIESSATKNLSEETTSSGNLAEDGERRFVVRVHRDFLERKVSYKSVVPIHDQSVVAKIHQNYRVAYIRDVILARLFDESVNSALTGVIVCNNVDIIMYFISSNSALEDLFSLMKSAILQRKRIRERSEMARSCGGNADCDASKASGVRSTQRGTKKTTVQFSGDDSYQSGGKSDEDQQDRMQSVDRPPAVETHSLKTTCTSGATRTTIGSHTTAAVEPFEPRESSSRGLTSFGRDRIDSANRDQGLSEKAEEGQENLYSVLGFLRELCSLAKGQQPPVKNRFHTLLRALGVLELAVHALQDENPTLRVLCCEVLSAVIAHDQTDVRSHILKGASQPPEKKPPRRLGIALRSAPVHIVNESEAKKEEPNRMEKAKSDNSLSGQQDGESNEERSDCKANLASNTKGSLVGVSRDGKDSAQCASGLGKINIPSPVKKVMRSLKQKFAPSSDRPRAEANDLTDTGDEGLPTRGGGRIINAPASDEHGPKFASSEETAHRILGVVNSSTKDTRKISKNRDELLGNALSRYGSYPIIGAMVAALGEDRESGIALSVLDLLKTLLDPNNMRTEKDTFLDKFYGEYINQLLIPIQRCVDLDKHRERGGTSSPWGFNANYVCDLLSYCVANHDYWGKYFVLNYDVGSKVAGLLNHRNVCIRLSALRFIRACVCLGDSCIDGYLIRCKLFNHIMDMFRRNGYQDNLASSAVLEVVAIVTQSKRFELLKCIVQEHGSVLERSEKYCGAFTEAKRTFNELHRACSEQNVFAKRSEIMSGDPIDSLEAHEQIEAKPTEGSGLADSAGADNGRTEDGDSSHEYRFVGGLFGHDLQIAPAGNCGDKLLLRSETEDREMEDVQSYINGEQNEEQINISDESDRPSVLKKEERLKTVVKAGCQDGNEQEIDTEKPRLAKKRPKECKLVAGGTKQESELSEGNEGQAVVDEVDNAALVESNTERREKGSRGGSDSLECEGSLNESTLGGSRGRLRLSMCKSDGGKMKMRQYETDGDEIICESSEGSRWCRKRERSRTGCGTRREGNSEGQGRWWPGDKSIETCTQGVTEANENGSGNGEKQKDGERDKLDSRAKRRRTDSTEGRKCVTRDEKGMWNGNGKRMGEQSEEDDKRLESRPWRRVTECEEENVQVNRRFGRKDAGKGHVVKQREEEVECDGVVRCREDGECGDVMDFESRRRDLDVNSSSKKRPKVVTRDNATGRDE